MMHRGIATATVATIANLIVTAKAQQPFALTWSQSVYGPDGPWHAVKASLGTPAQSVDLYPGSLWTSFPLTQGVCNDLSKQCLAPKAGLYHPTLSSSFQNITVGGTQTVIDPDDFHSSQWTISLNFTGSVQAATNTLSLFSGTDAVTIPIAGLEYIDDGSFNPPGRPTIPIEVGYLSMGSGVDVANFDSQPAQNPMSNISTLYNLPYSYLYKIGKIPSPSWSMHVGSSSANIAPSMYLGGYDQSRLFGPVLTQQLVLPPVFSFTLTDVGIGTNNKSVFSFDGSSQAGFVSPTTNFFINPTNPYISLERSTCDALASNLPVTYHEDIGYYIWNTTDAKYIQLMTSQSWLSFSLQPNNDQLSSVIEINVPFQLLNLTLEYPLAPDVQGLAYFPCVPISDNQQLSLGRAFLQAALLGVNWSYDENIGTWFLAQAPGPGYADPNVVALPYGAQALTEYSRGDWQDSWTGFWSSDAPARNNSTSSTEEDRGLSTGAQAGIGVGAAVAGLIIIFLAALALLRRRKRQRAWHAEVGQGSGLDASGKSKLSSDETTALYEMNGHTRPMEMDGQAGIHEMNAEGQVHEMGT